MSSRAEAYELLREIAGPLGLGDNVKTLLVRAHRKLAKHGFAFSRVRAIYHRDDRIKISADELQTLRAARSAALEQEGKDEIRELRRRVEKLEAMLSRREDSDGDRDS